MDERSTLVQSNNGSMNQWRRGMPGPGAVAGRGRRRVRAGGLPRPAQKRRPGYPNPNPHPRPKTPGRAVGMRPPLAELVARLESVAGAGPVRPVVNWHDMAICGSFCDHHAAPLPASEARRVGPVAPPDAHRGPGTRRARGGAAFHLLRSLFRGVDGAHRGTRATATAGDSSVSTPFCREFEISPSEALFRVVSLLS
jgi:hypothetical protein